MVMEYYLQILILLMPFLALSPLTSFLGFPVGIIWMFLTSFFVLGVVVERPFVLRWENIRKTPLVVPMLIFVLANVISLGYSLALKGINYLWINNVKELGFLVFAVIFYWAVTTFIDDREKYINLLKGVIFSSVAVSIYCLIRLLLYMKGSLFGAAQPWTVPRLAAPGGESQVMGGFVICVLPLVIAMILYRNQSVNKYYGILVSSILLLTLILTFSAGAWAGFAIAMIFMLCWFWNYDIRRLLAIGLVFLISFGGVFIIDKTFYPGYLEGFNSITHKVTGEIPPPASLKGKDINKVLAGELEKENSTESKKPQTVSEAKKEASAQSINNPAKYAESVYSKVERSWFRQALWAMFKSSPVLGVGPGNFERLYEKYRPDGTPVLPYQPKPHNQYLEILAETGIVGFFAFLFIIGNFLYLLIIFWHRLDDQDKKILFGLLASLVAVAVHGYVFGVLVHIQVWLLLSFAMAALNMRQNGRISSLWRGSLG